MNIPLPLSRIALPSAHDEWRSAALEIVDSVLKYGDQVVVPWETKRISAMFDALERFVIDLKTGITAHDGCPITDRHISSAVKVERGRDMYGLAKASRVQKIDAGVTSVLAHEAACDARTEELKPALTRVRGRVSAY